MCCQTQRRFLSLSPRLSAGFPPPTPRGQALRGKDGYGRVSSCGDGGGGGFGAAAPFDPRFSPMLDSLGDAVSVAKRLRRQVVALEIEGSNPFAHPTYSPLMMGQPVTWRRPRVVCRLFHGSAN